MDILQKHFPELTPQQLDQFARLLPLYTEWNAQINVISRKDMDHFYEHHVLHSLAITRFLDFIPGTRLLDIGTGGGFPAIPLAIFFPDLHITACDSIGKKIKVVTEIANALQLKNLTPHAGRAEQLTHTYDFIVSRAVAPLAQLFALTKNQLNPIQKNKRPNGWLCLKGGDLDAEINEVIEINKRLQVETTALSDFYPEEFFETKKLLYMR